MSALSASPELERLLAGVRRYVLVDDGKLLDEAPGEAIPFLERAGEYWGRPADSETAIAELERLRADGATHLVVALPAFWWLDHYTRFQLHLRRRYRLVHDDEQLIVFDLRDGPER